ncbi:RNA-binding S4 domain-containing protein [Chitinimonas sp. BJB300]|uniref:RNA-binding S4 domain-containing protein n=1 Tax=Chitinimonas sp. BJB300 TaxID=1559339 RepID=UPI000C101587|nr:RNA-binding S4 domain-containing protein [Chitinimonas sp. BJB300]PHV11176.1 RNA-binding protein [Chitinimonas sp. BJB300]TSJ87422.1 RNA-binding S4 domain-containing protein [Chitinimonas sp. BJB300]
MDEQLRPINPIRLDKWLWAARFFKTRSLASTSIDAGHVHLNDERAKPARNVKVGDRLRILSPSGEFIVTILKLDDRRGPASEAHLLYTETDASQQAREARRQAQKLAPVFNHPDIRGRPTKKWRRQLHYFERKQDE